MKKYMVMECHLSYAVVLDEDGRFLKVANRQYTVGQTVTDVIEMQMPPAAEKKKTRGWRHGLAAVAACLILALGTVFHLEQMTYASVYMTINPEVRIDVNRRDKVVGLDGINPDGHRLTADYSYRKKTLDRVMDELVDRAIDMGYLHEGGQITLVLDAESDRWIVEHGEALQTELHTHLDEKLSVVIEVTDRNTQSGQVVIPVTPAESDYEDSDYGDSDYEVSSAEEIPDTRPEAESNYGNSSYEEVESDYGSSYEEAESDHGNSSYEEAESDHGDSDYADTQSEEDADTDDSDYGEASDYDDSDYEEDER